MIYNENKIWTSALAPCRAHYLPVERTSTDSNIVNILQVKFLHELFCSITNWAVTCDFQQCGILTSVDSNEPVQPTFQLRKAKLSSVSSLTIIEY